MTAENAPGVGSTTDMVIMSPGEPGQLVFLPRSKIKKMRDLHQKWVRQDPSWEEDLKEILKEQDKDENGKRRPAEGTEEQEETDGSQTLVPDSSPKVRRHDGRSTTRRKKTKSNRN